MASLSLFSGLWRHDSFDTSQRIDRGNRELLGPGLPALVLSPSSTHSRSITIANEKPRPSIERGVAKLLSSPLLCRMIRLCVIDDLPRIVLHDDEGEGEGENLTEANVVGQYEVAGPYLMCMISTTLDLLAKCPSEHPQLERCLTLLSRREFQTVPRGLGSVFVRFESLWRLLRCFSIEDIARISETNPPKPCLFCMKALVAIPLVGLWLFSAEAAHADHCRLSQTTPIVDALSHTYTLPAVDRAYGDSWGNTSVRRDKSRMSSQPFNGSLRRVEIRAVESAVAFYAYTGNEFDGKVHATYCPKGQTCSVTWQGQVGLDSFICQREFADKANPTSVDELGNPSLPLAQVVEEFGDGFDEEVESSDQVEAYVDLDTAIRWRSRVTTRRFLGGTTTWSDRYRDDLVFYKKFLMQIAGLSTYVVDVKIFINPSVASQRFAFDYLGHHVSIPSGFLAHLASSNLSQQIDGPALEDRLNYGIRVEAGRKVCASLTRICGQNPSDDTLYVQGTEKIMDRKRRMQLSFVAQFLTSTGRRYFGWKDTKSATPTIVLNQDR